MEIQFTLEDKDIKVSEFDVDQLIDMVDNLEIDHKWIQFLYDHLLYLRESEYKAYANVCIVILAYLIKDHELPEDLIESIDIENMADLESVLFRRLFENHFRHKIHDLLEKDPEYYSNIFREVIDFGATKETYSKIAGENDIDEIMKTSVKVHISIIMESYKHTKTLYGYYQDKTVSIKFLEDEDDDSSCTDFSFCEN